MAKKKTTKKPKSLTEAVGFKNNILNNETTDFILGIVLLFVAVYLLIAMTSFFSTGQADQSLLENMKSGEWLNTNRVFQNYCGSIGAILSYWLISVNFGIPAFLIPIFIIVVALQLARAYRVNLWKWFFCAAFIMIWCSVAFAKFLTPLCGSLHFNPGGNHGMFCVQQMENIVGPPGLTGLLIIIALGFLTYLTTETITFVRKILNPIGYVTNKVTFIITNHKKNNDNDEPETEEITTLPDPDVFDDPEPQEVDFNENDTVTINTPNIVSSEDTDNDTDMDISIAEEEEKAQGKLVTNIDINTPINPKEPFTRYKYPTLDLLKKYEEDGKTYIDEQEQIANKNRIIQVLGQFGVGIKTIRATVGPTITLYEIQPAEGVRISRIKNLEDDIALSLAALGIRIIAPIPGKGTIGIEVPNAKPNIVSMESILNSKKFQETKFDLPIALGKTITNEIFMVDLAKIPHLLVAGATGQGKSVGLNAIITSLLYKKHPNELKFVLIDPKKVEFSVYGPIADHFMAAVDENEEPIITDVTKVVRTLNSLCKLMDDRYSMLKAVKARNIKEYNEKFVNHKLNLSEGHQYMPYIVVIIDEFGDLIMTAGKEIELPIARIAQLARAVGIHMVIATQRPTTKIITGNIKTNFPGRIAFRTAQRIDSMTILDQTGANQLIGRGDMLYKNGTEPVRVQCAFVDTPEVERINEYIQQQPGPVAPMELPEPATTEGGGGEHMGGGDFSSLDPFFEEAARAIVLSQQGSTSMIQRRFAIGYNRAGRLMDQLEQAGVVGAAQGSKPRDVLITDENSLNTLLLNMRK